MGRAHATALWAALTALFSNLAAVNIIALIGSVNPRSSAIAAAITSLFVAGAVYAKLRWDAVRRAEQGEASPPPPEQGEASPPPPAGADPPDGSG